MASNFYLLFLYICICVASTEAENVKEFENVLCKRIKAYLNVTSEFTKAVLMGQHAEYLIKTLIKTYKTLSTLTKYVTI